MAQVIELSIICSGVMGSIPALADFVGMDECESIDVKYLIHNN